MTPLGGSAPTPAALKVKAVRGAVTTTLAQWLGLAINLASTVILTRLLAPEDYGLVAMATAVVGFASLLQDFGLAQATVQAPAIDDAQITALFWVGAAFSGLAALGVAASAGVVAAFYGEPRIAPVMVALSGTCVLSGLGAQHRALLVRELRFTAVSVVGLIGTLAGFLAGLGLALASAGHWALVATHLAGGACTAAGYWIGHPWRPARPRRAPGLRPMLRFGGALSAFNFLNYFARNLDNVLIGRYWGSEALGLYSRAYALMLLPLNQFNAPVSSVAAPALSRVQEDAAAFRVLYVRALSAVALCGIPLFVGLAVLSREVIEVLFGERWLGAAPILTALALAGAVQPLTNATGWIYLALGRTDRMVKWGAGFVSVLVASFFVGLPWGPVGVAVAYAVAVYAVTYPIIAAACSGSPVSTQAFVRAAWRPAVLGVCFGVGALMARLLLSPLFSVYVTLVLSALSGALGCIAVCAASRTMRLEIARLVGLWRLVAGGGVGTVSGTMAAR